MPESESRKPTLQEQIGTLTERQIAIEAVLYSLIGRAGIGPEIAGDLRALAHAFRTVGIPNIDPVKDRLLRQIGGLPFEDAPLSIDSLADALDMEAEVLERGGIKPPG